jgi:hypothetical protein
MIQNVSLIFSLTEEIFPAFGIIKFYPAHGELHLDTYVVALLHKGAMGELTLYHM